MRSTLLSLVFLLGLGIAHANEGEGGGAPEGGGEAKGPEISPTQREYTDKTSKLHGLAAKLEESEKRFTEVVRAKDEAKGAEAKRPFLKELVDIAKERNANVVEYNKLNTEITLRFPERGHPLERHDEPEERSAEDLERQVKGVESLDEILADTKRLIDEKYGVDVPAPKAIETRRPASLAAPKPAEPRLRLEK